MTDSQHATNRIPDGETAETVFISVDVETAGPHPAEYALLSIGACLVSSPTTGFYVELKPDHRKSEPGALAISRLSLGQLAVSGTPPADAMASFERWLQDSLPPRAQPLFVGFNAAFDWMFVNHYFYRYLGRNPFGHSALDIKSFYMGLKSVPWSETSMHYLAPRYLSGTALSHHALQDARDQAQLFGKLLAESARTKSEMGLEGS